MLDDTEEYTSKTQKKKDALALQKLGEKLVKLSAEQIEEIDLPAEIYDAVKQEKTIKSHGARRRHMQYIGTLMRKIDPGPIQEAIDNIEQGNYKKAMDFKETEMWRDELMDGNNALIEEILERYPEADRQQLSQHVRNAIKEKSVNKPPKASRVLFRYLVKIKSNKN